MRQKCHLARLFILDSQTLPEAEKGEVQTNPSQSK